VTQLLLKRARDIAPGVDPAETSLLIVAHGTNLNENSAVAAKREAEKIRAIGKFAAVLNVYMEEPPLVSDWRKLTKTRNIVVVPFFISDGLHSYEDIPQLIGIADRRSTITSHAARGEIFRRNPYRINGRTLFYAPSLGTDPGLPDLIAEQAGVPKSENRAGARFVFAQDCCPANEGNHLQEASGDRGVCAGWRLHQKANEATSGDDSRRAELPV